MASTDSLLSEGWTWAAPLPEPLVAALEAASEGPEALRRVRPLAPLIQALEGSVLDREMTARLGPGAAPRRAFLMDKREGDNWEIAFHQDTTFAVQEPIEVPGFQGWVHKGDWYHVQAPSELLRQMLSTRIHFDDVAEGNGALKVIPGSHGQGRLDDAQRTEWLLRGEPLTCPARRGEVLLMHPLLLHGSERARVPTRRRILHLEWAAFDLPGGLRWAWE
jgi:hypothetical protein